MTEITLAMEIQIEANWFGVGKLSTDKLNELAIGVTRAAVFGEQQTGLDRF